MAYEIIRPNFQLPVRPASNIVPRQIVGLGGTSGLLALAVGSINVRPFGINGEATGGVSGNVGDAVQAQPIVLLEEGNIVKAVCGASVGAGAEVAIATYGVATLTQGGSYAATVSQLGPAAAASGTGQWNFGISMEPGQPGSLFTVYVKPRYTGAVL